MKKRNKKGFTLVELVVVATIMVMIMGAILNWVRPMNKFYDRTQALSDSNDIGSILMDKVDDELRYATNIVVLQGYNGVPMFSGGHLVNSSGQSSSAFSAKLTNALIIDNEAIRGSQLKGYDANSNASHRKGAKGCILKASIRDDVGIDVERLECLGSEALYSDYGCHFEASLKVLENKNKGKNLTIDMELTRPERDGAGYKFEKFGFNQSRDFELVNINLTDAAVRNYQADFFSSLGVGKPLDYSQIAPASTNTGSLSGTYTYILYSKEASEATKLTVTVYDDNSKVIWKPSVDCGYSLDASKIDSLISIYSSKVGTTGNKTSGYTKKSFDGILTDAGENLEDYKTKGVSQNLEFHVRYSYSTVDPPKNTFTFHDKFRRDNGLKEQAGQYNEFTDTEFGFFDATEEGYDGTATFVCDPRGKAEDGYVFKGWYNADVDYIPTQSADDDSNYALGWYVSGKQYTGSPNFYAIYEEKPTKKFNGGNGDFNLVTDSNVIDNSNIKALIQQAINNPPTDDGKNWRFEHFEVKDGENVVGEIWEDKIDFDLENLSDDVVYEIVPIYVEDTHPGSYEVIITIKNTAYDNRLYINTGNGGHFAVYTDDGNTVVLKEQVDMYGNYHPCPSPVEGNVYKLYVYDESTVSFGYGSSEPVSVTGNGAYEVDGPDKNSVTLKKIR